MIIPTRVQEALDLLVTEVTEGVAASQILWGYIAHHEHLCQEEKELHQAWYFVEQSVSWKLALAINRLLQPEGKDRASLLGFFREVRAAHRDGFELRDQEAFARAVAETERIRALPIVGELRNCRDNFVAHTLIGGRRTGIKTLALQELLEEIEPVIEDCWMASTATQSPLWDRYADWVEWSALWWRRVMPEPSPSPAIDDRSA